MKDIDELLIDKKAERKREKIADLVGTFMGHLLADLIPPVLTALPLLWGYNTLSHFVALPKVSYGEMLLLAWGLRSVGKLLRKG